MTRPHEPSRRGTVVIVSIGALLILAVWVWGGATYDSHGQPLVDDAMTAAIASIIVAAITVGAAFVERSLKHMNHELTPNHGSSMKDASVRQDTKLDDALDLLREMRRDVGGIREELRGVHAMERADNDRMNHISDRVSRIEHERHDA